MFYAVIPTEYVPGQDAKQFRSRWFYLHCADSFECNALWCVCFSPPWNSTGLHFYPTLNWTCSTIDCSVCYLTFPGHGRNVMQMLITGTLWEMYDSRKTQFIFFLKTCWALHISDRACPGIFIPENTIAPTVQPLIQWEKTQCTFLSQHA